MPPQLIGKAPHDQSNFADTPSIGTPALCGATVDKHLGLADQRRMVGGEAYAMLSQS